MSLVSEDLAEPLDPAEAGPPIRVEHSSRRKENALRRSLIPGLLNARRHNEAHGTPDAELFEIANVYLPRAGRPLPEEPTRLGIVARPGDFRGLKGIVEALLDRFHALRAMEVKPASLPWCAAGRAAELLLEGRRLGFLGEIDASRLQAFDLRTACSAAEPDFDVLKDRADLVPRYRPLPPYPAVARDLSLVVPQALPWAELAATVGRAGGSTLEAVDYLDTFRGGNVPEGRQSLHFGLRFRHPERTLTGEEVEAAVRAIVERCVETFQATLRG